MGGKPDKDQPVFEENETVDQDDSVAHIDFLEIHFGSAGMGAGAVIMIIISALLIVCLFAACFRIYHRYQRQRQERHLFKHQRVQENPIQMSNLVRSQPVHIPPTGAPLNRTTSAFEVGHETSHPVRNQFVPPSDPHRQHYGTQEDERPPLNQH